MYSLYSDVSGEDFNHNTTKWYPRWNTSNCMASEEKAKETDQR